MERVALCSSCSSCPCVEVGENEVRIGEDGSNWVTLNKEQWNILVAKIKAGELEAL